MQNIYRTAPHRAKKSCFSRTSGTISIDGTGLGARPAPFAAPLEGDAGTKI